MVSFQQTVDLIRVTIDVVEEHVDELAPPGDEALLRENVLRYSREIAFAAANVYAQAAEARGAWDARLEALVVDALLRGEIDEDVRSRAAALGWSATGSVTVVVGRSPIGSDPETVVEHVQRAARHAKLSVLAGVQGERLVAVLGDVTDPMAAARSLLGQFGRGPVVAGPLVPDLLQATRSADEAIAGLRASVAWPGAPRPVSADDLLPERALAGDPTARRRLVDEVYRPLADEHRRAARHRRGVPRAGAVARGRGARAVRAPQHRALPAAPGRRRHRRRADRSARRGDPAGRADPRPARGRRRASCRVPTKSRGRSS